jgi:hypothetical protein
MLLLHKLQGSPEAPHHKPSAFPVLSSDADSGKRKTWGGQTDCLTALYKNLF